MADGVGGADGPGGPAGGSSSAVDAVVAKLKLMIASRQLGENDRLPPERQLAAEMGVSRNTIREALATLARMGLVEVKRGSGAFVRSLSSTSLLESMAVMVEVSPTERLLEYLTIRRIVEAETAALAAVHIADDELARLEACVDRMSPPGGSGGTTEEDQAADIEFHAILNAAARNPALEALGTALNSMTFRARIAAGMYRTSGTTVGTRGEHEAIFAAVRDHDPSRAGTLAAAHVIAVETALRAALDREDTGVEF
ncbi:FadR/GntR family transcriptional regulator [Streptomyces sp. NPDC050560]|uniref:FadR/GntR family transcriptional regulator n=1 Tax=Streptomyces sp. NPDC050560 TaxID=3365630 RepID=UPI0037B5C10C